MPTGSPRYQVAGIAALAIGVLALLNAVLWLLIGWWQQEMPGTLSAEQAALLDLGETIFQETAQVFLLIAGILGTTAVFRSKPCFPQSEVGSGPRRPPSSHPR